MTNEEAIKIISQMIKDEEGFLSDDTIEAHKMAIKALETIPKYKDAYNKGWDDGAKATYEHLKMCEEEQDGDLISRDAVIDITWEEPSYTDALNVLTEVRDKVKALPSVKQEPMTGHWVDIDEEPHEDYECDKCGYTISTYTANIEPHTEYKYCPNCGAKMVEPQESEVQHDTISVR